MNTATLGQIKKLLTLLDQIPTEQVQEALGSAHLADVLNCRMDQKLLRERWKLVCQTANPEDIVVTKPHEPATYFIGTSRVTKYQVRVWKGSHGHFKGCGHVSDGGLSAGGPLLFEYYTDAKQAVGSNYPQTNNAEFASLFSDGLSNGDFPGFKWVKETKLVEKKGAFDVFTIRRIT